MKTSDVMNWLLSECQTVLEQSNCVSLTDASDHVDVAQPSIDHPYPFVGVQRLATNPISAGIGNGDIYVDSLNYGSDNLLDSITYRRESSMRCEVIPVTDNNPSLRDDLGDELADHFSLLSRTKAQPEDMDPPQVDDNAAEGRPEDFIDSSGIGMTIEYEHFIVDNDPPVAKNANLTVRVGDSLEDLENWGEDDWNEYDWGSSDPVAFNRDVYDLLAWGSEPWGYDTWAEG